MLNAILEKIEKLQENAIKKIKDSKNVNELNESKAEFLGKKSPISEIMSKMKELSVDMKKDVCQIVNAFKQKVE